MMFWGGVNEFTDKMPRCVVFCVHWPAPGPPRLGRLTRWAPGVAITLSVG